MFSYIFLLKKWRRDAKKNLETPKVGSVGKPFPLNMFRVTRFFFSSENVL